MNYDGEHWIFNIGTGKEASVLELVDVIHEIVGIGVQAEHVEPRKGEVYKIALDNRLIQRELNWKPKVDLKPGMQQVFDWMKTTF